MRAKVGILCISLAIRFDMNRIIWAILGAHRVLLSQKSPSNTAGFGCLRCSSQPQPEWLCSSLSTDNFWSPVSSSWSSCDQTPAWGTIGIAEWQTPTPGGNMIGNNDSLPSNTGTAIYYPSIYIDGSHSSSGWRCIACWIELFHCHWELTERSKIDSSPSNCMF